MLWDSFHFLRPLWLAMIIPAVLLFTLLRQKLEQKNSWKQVIAPHLLTPLLETGAGKSNRPPLYLLLIAWVIASIALAGPTWKKVPVPVTKPQQPLVVVADMSMSMLATDIKPNRLARLKYKLLDLFKERKEGLTGLVVYAGTAHTVAPLTDDSRTLANLVKALSPNIMPAPGNSPPEGIEAAINLIKQGTGQHDGHILLITDQITDAESRKIESMLRSTGTRLSIIGIGSEQGAPISLARGGFLKDNQGKIVIPQLERHNLLALAEAGKGAYHDFTIDDADLKATLPKITKNTETIEVERQFDQWHDMGFWLVLLLLPFAIGAFRKGWLTVALLAILYPQAQPTMALDWQPLWKNENQRGAEALHKGHPEEAAKLFENQDWKAEALYQAKEYKEAASLFGTSDTPAHLYNKGNALAQSNQLKDSISTYKQALASLEKIADSHQNSLKKDIQFNKSLVEKLLQEQQRQQQQQDKQNKQDHKDQQNQQDQKNQDQQGQNDQNNQQQQNDQKNQQNQQQQQQQQQNDQKSQQNQQQQQQNDQANQQQDNQHQQANRDNQTHNDQQQAPPSQQEQSDKEREQTKGSQQQKEHTSNNRKQPEQSAAQQQQQSDKDGQQKEQPMTETDFGNPQSLEQQALESWLRTIPDDPGGLLRRKFLQQREQEQRERQRQAW